MMNEVLEDMRLAASAIRQWMPETHPAGEDGKIHFARLLSESAAEAIEAFLAAPAPADRVRVKPLEWKDYPGSRLTGESRERYGFHEFGSYLIMRDGGYYSLSTFTNMGAMRPMGEFKLLDDATGAAQADFDQRIFSIVTPPPAPMVGVGIPSLVEAIAKLCEETAMQSASGRSTEKRYSIYTAGQADLVASNTHPGMGYAALIREKFARQGAGS